MLEIFFNFVKNHISIIISLISLLLSVYNFIYLLFIRHKNLEFQILKYKLMTMNGYNIYQFQFIVTNKSQLSISISNISIDNLYCKFDPTRITNKISTVSFPIVLHSLEAKSGWLEFKSKNEIEINTILFNFYTSRGSIKNLIPKTENIIDDTPCRNNGS